jgi:hypothetical protein
VCAFRCGWKCYSFDSEFRSCCTIFLILHLSKFSLINGFSSSFARHWNMGSYAFVIEQDQ